MSGQSIKTLGTFVQVIGIICSVISAIFCWVQGAELTDSYSTEELGVFVIFMGFVCLIVGVFGSIMISVLITGFGELVENSEITLTHLSNIERRMECDVLNSNEKSTCTAPCSSEIQSIAVSDIASNLSADNVVAQQIQKNNVFESQQNNAKTIKEQEEINQMWKCPSCANFNFGNTNECVNCHTKR